MEHPPVRSYIAGILLATVTVFVGTVSFRLAAATPASAGSQPVAAAPKPRATDQPAKRPATTQPAANGQASASAAGQSKTTHVVRSGETLTSIGRLYGQTAAAIKQANGMTTDALRAGQQLTIPGATALRRHTVGQGDSLWELSIRYGVSMADLLETNPTVDNAGHLQIGQELIIPSRSLSAPTSTTATRLIPDLSLSGLFSWPVAVPAVSSEFGPRWGRNHNGVDFAANTGEPIKAARDGDVLLAGEVQGYGLTVVLAHADGTRTLYAHSSKLHVKAGQRVKQGEVIAAVGSTGNSTGPHLHFEIIVNDRPQDPLKYLPQR